MIALGLIAVSPLVRFVAGSSARVAQVLGQSGMAAMTIEKVARASRWIRLTSLGARSVGVVEVAAGLTISVDQLIRSCGETVDSGSNPSTCKNISDSEFRDISSAKMDHGSCTLAIISSAISAGAGGLGLKEIFLNSPHKKLLAELEARTQNFKSNPANQPAKGTSQDRSQRSRAEATGQTAGVDYTPISARKFVAVDDIERISQSEVAQLNNMGIRFKDEPSWTWLDLDVLYRGTKIVKPGTSGVVDIKRSSIGGITEFSKNGRLLKVIDVPPTNLKKGGPETNVFSHPEFPTYWAKLKDMGYEVVVDTSLNATEAAAWHSPGQKLICLRSNSNWSDFMHEVQHAEFNIFFRQHYERFQTEVVGGTRLKAILPEETIKAYGSARVAKLESLMRRQLPSRAANETMSVDDELKLLGWRRYTPGVGSTVEEYALKYQITELRKVILPSKNGQLVKYSLAYMIEYGVYGLVNSEVK